LQFDDLVKKNFFLFFFLLLLLRRKEHGEHMSLFVDTNYEKLKDVMLRHKKEWIDIGEADKELALVQLNKNIEELFKVYGTSSGMFAQGFKEIVGPPLCGQGPNTAPVVVFFQKPCYMSQKYQNLNHFSTYKKRNADGEEEEHEVKTNHVQTIALLQTHGINYVNYYSMCYFPYITKYSEPSQLLTTVFSNYARRRLDILRPEVVIAGDSWSAKLALGKFTYKGLETDAYLRVGCSRKMTIERIVGGKLLYKYLLCRIPHPFSLNTEKQSREEVDALFCTGVEPLIPVLKKALYRHELGIAHCFSDQTKGLQGGKLDAFSLISKGVRHIIPSKVEDNTEHMKEESTHDGRISEVKDEPDFEDDDGDSTPRNPTLIRIKMKKEEEDEFMSIMPSYSSLKSRNRRLPADSPRFVGSAFRDPISEYTTWALRKRILGFLGPIDMVYFLDAIDRMGTNTIVDLSGADSHPFTGRPEDNLAVCCLFTDGQPVLSAELVRQYDVHLSSHFETYERNCRISGTTSVRFDESTTYDFGSTFKLAEHFFTEIALIYTFLEDKVLGMARASGCVSLSTLPKIILWSSPGREPDGAISSEVMAAPGDSFAFFTLALIFLFIRDIILKVRIGAYSQGHGGFGTHERTTALDYKEVDSRLLEIEIEKKGKGGMRGSPLVDPIHLFTKRRPPKEKPSQLRTNARKEVTHVQQILQELRFVYNTWWNGFTLLQTQVLQQVIAHIHLCTAMATGISTSDPSRGSTGDIVHPMSGTPYYEEVERKTREEMEKEDIEQRQKVLREALYKYLTPGQPCPLCVCPKHGHNNFATNLCKDRSCRPPFREPSLFRKSNPETSDAIEMREEDNGCLTPLDRAIAALDVCVLTSRVEEELHFGLQDSFIENYVNGKGSTLIMCDCVLCNTEGGCIIDWV